MPSQSVLVIGGGLAGLSSAVALADAGYTVQLLEKRPHLGGRATSYTLPDGSEVDNCQHLTLGCCTNLADFYKRVGAADKVRFYDTLIFADKTGKRSTMRANGLPAPLHMTASFLKLGSLTLADKYSIANAMMAIAMAGGKPAYREGLSMLDWLHRMKQTPGAIERFWRPVLVSALDEELAQSDARYGIEVFWKAFLGSAGGYKIGVPTVPLADLYDGCRGALEKRGGSVTTRAGVQCIEVDPSGTQFRGVVLEDGSILHADACVAAVPHSVLLGIVPKEMSSPGGALAGVEHIKTSPITGVHFWYDRVVMDEPYLALLDHTTQWVFNKTMLSADANGANGTNGAVAANGGGGAAGAAQYLQMVISASYDLVPKSRQEIIELCRTDLADVLPATRDAQLVKATVIKEVHATFSPAPGVDQWRPPQQTRIKGLALAGDWTSTGWPSTMEGAVRSGYLAAEAVTRGLSAEQKFLQPDMAFEGLSKFWAERAGKKRAAS
jgi:squalene-associated FAD-dependent desaturase